MQGVEHALVANWAELAIGAARPGIPEQYVVAFNLADDLLHLDVEVEADHTRQLEPFVRGETRRTEGIPSQHVPFGESVEMVLALDGGELFHAPLLHFAARGFERVLGTYRVW